jgi:drug/metabolite transporter (DMT)-like permease
LKHRLPAARLSRGIALTLVTTAMFSTLDTLSKLLNQYLPVNEIFWGRYVFHGLALVLLMGPRMKLDLVRTAHPAVQILRGLLLAGASATFITSLLWLPLAEAAALAFVSPLMMTALSGPLLGERVNKPQWIAVSAGFVGVLVIVRPGGALFELATALPLGSALFYGLFQIITRKYAGRDSAYTTHFWTALVCTCLATLTLPIWWTPPSLWNWLGMIGMGLVGGGGHYLLIRAFECAPPHQLAPFTYVQLIWSTLITWLLFDHIPDSGTQLGMAIIIGSGLFAVWTQRRTMRANEEGIAPD